MIGPPTNAPIATMTQVRLSILTPTCKQSEADPIGTRAPCVANQAAAAFQEFGRLSRLSSPGTRPQRSAQMLSVSRIASRVRSVRERPQRHTPPHKYTGATREADV